jgi:PhnB protein
MLSIATAPPKARRRRKVELLSCEADDWTRLMADWFTWQSLNICERNTGRKDVSKEMPTLPRLRTLTISERATKSEPAQKLARSSTLFRLTSFSWGAFMAVKPVPDGYHTATPYLVVQGAAKAIEYYKKAFGATEEVRMDMPDGSVMHAEIKIGDSMIMLGEENLAMGAKSPATLGGSPVSIMLYVPDVDTLTKQALDAGATVERPIQDQFWGDRMGAIIDPFGHKWAIATHKEDVSVEETAKRFEAVKQQMCGK